MEVDMESEKADLKSENTMSEVLKKADLKLYNTMTQKKEILKPINPGKIGMSEQTSEAKDVIKKAKSKFEAKMSDDLNSSPILTGALQKAMKFINVSNTKLKKMQKQQWQQRMSLAVSLVEVEKAARGILDVLGLLTPLSYAEFLKEMKQKALARAGLGEEEVFQKIEERKMKRKMKEFERSDEIRDSLAVKGISLMDISGKDTLWRPCSQRKPTTVWRPCLPCSSQPKPGTVWRPFLPCSSQPKPDTVWRPFLPCSSQPNPLEEH